MYTSFYILSIPFLILTEIHAYVPCIMRLPVSHRPAKSIFIVALHMGKRLLERRHSHISRSKTIAHYVPYDDDDMVYIWTNVASGNYVPPRFSILELETSKLRWEKFRLVCTKTSRFPTRTRLGLTRWSCNLWLRRGQSEFNVHNIDNLKDEPRERERELNEKKKTSQFCHNRDRLTAFPRSIGHLQSCSAPITWKYWKICRYTCEIYFPKIDVKSIGSSRYINNELPAQISIK